MLACWGGGEPIGRDDDINVITFGINRKKM